MLSIWHKEAWLIYSQMSERSCYFLSIILLCPFIDISSRSTQTIKLHCLIRWPRDWIINQWDIVNGSLPHQRLHTSSPYHAIKSVIDLAMRQSRAMNAEKPSFSHTVRGFVQGPQSCIGHFNCLNGVRSQNGSWTMNRPEDILMRRTCGIPGLSRASQSIWDLSTVYSVNSCWLHYISSCSIPPICLSGPSTFVWL